MSDFLSYAYSKSLNEFQGNNKRAKTVNEELVLSCLKLAYTEAKRYYDTSSKEISLEDVSQAAMEGLCVAAVKYNDLDIKFSSYAWFWIKKYILYTINVTARPIAVAEVDGFERVTDNLKFVSKDCTTKFNSGDDTTLEEILFPLSEDNYADIMDLKLSVKSARETISRLLEPLTKNERRITCSYFGLAPFESTSTIQQVATQFKFSKPYIETVIDESIEKMRLYAKTENIDMNRFISDVNTIRNANVEIEKAPDYIDSRFLKFTDLDEKMVELQTKSGISDTQMQMALNFDIDGLYNFISVRQIAGYTIYKRHTIVKRYTNFTVTVDSYYSVFDADGIMVKPEQFLKKEKTIEIREFSEYCTENRISQLMSPLHPL